MKLYVSNWECVCVYVCVCGEGVVGCANVYSAYIHKLRFMVKFLSHNLLSMICSADI